MNGASNHVLKVEGGTVALTQIRGIGATKKQWLAALGIYTVEALAQIEAEALKTQLNDLGYTVSRTEIDAWIQQAQAIALAPSQPEPASATADHSSTGAMPTWSTISSFQIEFQTRSMNEVNEQQILVQKLDDGVKRTWLYLSENELQTWMLEQIQPEFKQSFLSSELESRSATSAPVQDDSFNIEISHIQIYQPATMTAPITVEAANPFMTGTLVVDQPIALELRINRVDDKMARSTPLTFCTTYQAKHLATGAIIELGSTRMLVQPQAENLYSLRLPEAVLPQPGAYRLTVITSVAEHPAISASFKVPTLQLQGLAPARYQVSELQMSCGI